MPSLDPTPFWPHKGVGIILPGSVLSAGMLPSALMRERTPHQPTSIRVLMIGSEYTVKHRNFGNYLTNRVEDLRTKFPGF